MTSGTPKLKALAIVLGPLALVAAFAYAAITSALSAHEDITAATRKAQGHIVHLERSIARLSGRIAILEAELARSAETVPQDYPTIAEVQAHVQDIARAKGVRLQSIRARTERDASEQTRLRFDIRLNERFEQVATFLADLEQSDLTLLIDDLSMQTSGSAQGPSGTAAPPRIDARFALFMPIGTRLDGEPQ